MGASTTIETSEEHDVCLESKRYLASPSYDRQQKGTLMIQYEHTQPGPMTSGEDRQTHHVRLPSSNCVQLTPQARHRSIVGG